VAAIARRVIRAILRLADVEQAAPFGNPES